MAERWMVQARASYAERIRRMALDAGFELRKVLLEDPNAEPLDYLDIGWACEGDEPSFYMLRSVDTGAELFRSGHSLGQIEEYLQVGCWSLRA
ncbi:MAG: hypothetical protein P4L93_08220 [Coriobacteriia bacterium]|nr:hypothetical protein [Coriobacteriia bacterium]